LLEIINEDNYVITNDNFKKMILILYRIASNIPVILMGETGCGKTSLIIKLNQLMNDGKNDNFVKININPNYNDEKLIKEMTDINEKAKDFYGKDFLVFFDELNTCDSLVLITEIFMKRTFNGIKLEENIKLIGACNPYREKRKNELWGLKHPNEENKENQKVYKVKNYHNL